MFCHVNPPSTCIVVSRWDQSLRANKGGNNTPLDAQRLSKTTGKEKKKTTSNLSGKLWSLLVQIPYCQWLPTTSHTCWELTLCQLFFLSFTQITSFTTTLWSWYNYHNFIDGKKHTWDFKKVMWLAQGHTACKLVSQDWNLGWRTGLSPTLGARLIWTTTVAEAIDRSIYNAEREWTGSMQSGCVIIRDQKEVHS